MQVLTPDITQPSDFANSSNKKLDSPEFKRLTGIQPNTFQEMVRILKDAEVKRISEGGKPHRLTIEDKVKGKLF